VTAENAPQRLFQWQRARIPDTKLGLRGADTIALGKSGPPAWCPAACDPIVSGITKKRDNEGKKRFRNWGEEHGDEQKRREEEGDRERTKAQGEKMKKEERDKAGKREKREQSGRP